jgi:hypothetical protein
VTPFCCPFTWRLNDKFCSSNILYPPLLSTTCNLPSRRGLLFDPKMEAKFPRKSRAVYIRLNGIIPWRQQSSQWLPWEPQVSQRNFYITDQQIFMDNTWLKWHHFAGRWQAIQQNVVYFLFCFFILYYDQQMHNYLTYYPTPTCFDTTVSSSGSL